MSTRWPILIVPVLLVGATARAQDSVQPGKATQPKLAEPTSAPAPEQDPAARRAMDRSTEALGAARAITYDAVYSVSGALGSAVPFKSARGSATMVRVGPQGAPEPGGRWAIRVHGKGDTSRDKDVAFDASFINGQTEWLDADKKKLMERADSEARGPAVMMPKTTMRIEGMLTDPPFRVDLDHAVLTLEGQDEVAGVRCDVVLLTRGSGGRQKRWYIAIDDGIPRRAVEISSGSMAGELDITLSNVRVDVGDPPGVDVASLRVPVPEGYTEDRAKAAPRTPPTPPPSTSVTPPPEPAQPPTPEPPKPASPAPPPPPKMFPDVELDQAGGGKLKFADLRGSVFVVDFYGSWCIPAPAWHAHLNTLARQFAPTGVRFFGVGVRERDNANLVNDTHETTREFTLLLNGDALARELGARVFPACVVVDKDGHVAALIQGARGEDSAKEVSDALQKALGLGSPAEKGGGKPGEGIAVPGERAGEAPPKDDRPEDQPK